ncbi:MAG: glycosyltransferase family 4 protein [Desulfobacterales bacterium]
MKLNIGFVSTRFAGIDGVSLESSKWARVFEDEGHTCFWFAGELSKHESISLQVSQANFKDEKNQWINRQLFGTHQKSLRLARIMCDYKSTIASRFKLFIDMYQIDLLVVENALAIPMHIPLGLALTDVIAETGIPTIAHHHDFYWERNRYLPLNGSKVYIHRAFPPRLPNIEHVVINSKARNDLARRRKIAATVIPNAVDFENPPTADKERISAFRHSVGLKPDDIMFLQPTRIVQRKGIESAIKLVKELNHPKYKLVLSHEAGDEGFEYMLKIKELARQSGIRIRFIHNRVDDPFASRQDSNDRFSLWEVYQAADFVTYPSLYEGFGNALLETIYFKKPLLVNRYKIFKDDIEPLGFDVVKMDGALTREVLADVKNIIDDKYRREKMVATNYRIAGEHYSFAFLRKQFASLISNLFPQQCRPHQACHQAAAGR